CMGGSVVDWLADIDGQEDCNAYAGHVAAHQVEYRPQGYADCLAEYDTPCDQPTTSCAYDILHGLVPDGQPCPVTEVCGTDSACDQVCAQGAGTARRALGATCADAPTGCMTWNRCDDTTGTCVVAGRPGQPCAAYPGSPDSVVCFTGACFNNMTCMAFPTRGG